MKQLLTKAFGYAAKPLGYTAQALGGFGAATGGLGLYFGSWTHVGASGDITSLGVAFTAASAGLYYLGKKLAASGKSTTPNNDTPPITLPIPAPKSGRKSAQSGFKK
ncbi:MAG: hypothetical protein H6867_10465 [Rhodospirillales bacterium]|nr:hypothetical protein [Rhodospirillales bacterium]MCB9995793.1 hypothetical protein [Rhodospirillales bacterium]